MRKVGTLIRKSRNAPIEKLIKDVNSILRGWAYYHRHVVSYNVFRRVDNYVYLWVWKMIKRRHPKRSTHWLYKKYWTAAGKNWIFSVKVEQTKKDKSKKGKQKKKRVKVYQVCRVSSIGIRRHRKIKADANPYMPEYGRYFYERRHNKEAKLLEGYNSRQMRMAYNY